MKSKEAAERAFKTAYAGLHTAQRTAVDAIEGPVFVVAGPGTGKTQIITLRIANILRRTDTRPENILALTFTEAGAENMRARLANILGTEAYRVAIYTFHGFSEAVFAKFPEYFIDRAGFRAAAELDQIMIVQSLLSGSGYAYLTTLYSPHHYVQDIVRALSLLKRENVSPTDLIRLLDAEAEAISQASDYRHASGAHAGKVRKEYIEREHRLLRNRELSDMYLRYEAVLKERRLYDFDDMVVSLVRKLEADEEFRLVLQEEYQYLLADEHQDANGAQNRILELLSSFHASPNLCIVGDEKQAIYRFQGASLQNFAYFHARHPDARIVILKKSYRSTQTILDAAHALVSYMPASVLSQGIHSRLQAAHTGRQTSPMVISYEDTEAEAEGVAQHITNSIRSGIRPEHIALIARTNKELGHYTKILEKNGIRVSLSTQESVLDDLHVEKLIVILRAAHGVGIDSALFPALHYLCFKIPETDLFRLAQYAKKTRQSSWYIMQSSAELKKAGIIENGQIRDAARKLLSWSKLGQEVSPVILLSIVLKESGLMEEIAEDAQVYEKFKKLGALFTYLESYERTHRKARIGELIRLFELLETYPILDVSLAGGEAGAVQLMTAHRAKGLEFEAVYIVGARDGNWGGRRGRTVFKIPGFTPTTPEEEEADERRLFYVAMTRAKHMLAISYARQEEGEMRLPSRFIAELGSQVTHHEEKQSRARAARAERFLPETRRQKNAREIKAFIEKLLSERGISATGLNQYLSCPWEYFYRSLLGIPEPESLPLMYGNAVHAALKRFFDAWAHGEKLSRAKLLKIARQELEKSSMNDVELKLSRASAVQSLGGYYDTYYPRWNVSIRNEIAVTAMFTHAGFSCPLIGKIDKVEFLGGEEVRVVDYKTGRPKSRARIEGKTKDEDSGRYLRQLVFYKLLLDRQEKHAYQAMCGMIDFVEPDIRGKYRREEFVLSLTHVKELEEYLAHMIADLRSLAFWSRRCGKKTCEYCRLRDILEKSKKRA